MTREIFLPLVGQYENIGDIILRRPLADWLRPLGRLHIFLGQAPSGYERALRLSPEDRVYRSFGTWYKAGLVAAASGRAHYAFKPGEIQLTLIGMKEHLGMLPMLTLARARRGRVLRVGSGTRNFAQIPRMLMLPSLALCDICVWRDGETARFMGSGEVMPDLAFAEGDAVSEFAPADARELLVVSLRGDRPAPDSAWIHGLRMLADAHRFEIVVVTQVLPDESRTQELAAALGAVAVTWNGENHDRHETQLRALYRRTRMVISDRLHVLIAACTHGAIPVGICTDREDKIRRHFAAAGVPLLVMDMHRFDAAAEQTSSQFEARASATCAALARARDRLTSVRGRISDVLSPASNHAAARP